MERVLSRALLKQVASAFDGWKAWAGTVKARVLRLQKVVFRMQRTKLGAAFFAWVAQANARTTRALAAWSAAVSLWKDERRQDILSNSLLRW